MTAALTSTRPTTINVSAKDGPLMDQVNTLQSAYPESLVLIRVGDYYNLFNDQARTAAKALHITLTSRRNAQGISVPMAGVPYHALRDALDDLTALGHRLVVVSPAQPKR